MEFEIKGKGTIKVLPELYEHLHKWYLVEPGDFVIGGGWYDSWHWDKENNKLIHDSLS